eukprot:6978042-Prymnesium_polylepis.1
MWPPRRGAPHDHARHNSQHTCPLYKCTCSQLANAAQQQTLRGRAETRMWWHLEGVAAQLSAAAAGCVDLGTWERAAAPTAAMQIDSAGAG